MTGRTVLRRRRNRREGGIAVRSVPVRRVRAVARGQGLLQQLGGAGEAELPAFREKLTGCGSRQRRMERALDRCERRWRQISLEQRFADLDGKADAYLFALHHGPKIYSEYPRRASGEYLKPLSRPT